jgi:cardiolipin synthase C
MKRHYILQSLFLLLIISGCSSIPKDVERLKSYALTETNNTTLAELVLDEQEKHHNLSGFFLLDRGKAALDARLALVDNAEKSIDIQTFIWKQDTASRILAERLLNAADKGVRVRILIDDFNLKNRDFGMAAFDAHPNVNIRIFNPFGTRFYLTPINLKRSFELITDLSRLNHRMHNKVFVVDNKLGIVGGRNVADEYYGFDDEYNFFDLDLLVSGPVLNDVSIGFDDYWNSEMAFPVTAFADHPSKESLPETYDSFRSLVAEERQELGVEIKNSHYQHNYLKQLVSEFIWAPAKVVIDDPNKGEYFNEKIEVEGVVDTLVEVARTTTSELIIVSPYFVPGPNGSQALAKYDDRGIDVKVLTNSMAATDQVAAFSGFARYRKELISSGTDVYELKPDVSEYVIEPDILGSSGNGGLHAKVMTFDREQVFVGSFNLDPRSINLNTEIGLLVFSEELATQVAEIVDDLMQTENSWQTKLDNEGELIWQEYKDGVPITHTSDPEANVMRKLKSFIFSMLPIEEHL